MKRWHKALAVAMLQGLVLSSVGATLFIERQLEPRVWIQTQPFDPNLPIRGRYLRLGALVRLDGVTPSATAAQPIRVRLRVEDQTLVAVPDDRGPLTVRAGHCPATPCWVLGAPMAYFIAEHAADPSPSNAGDALWVEASIPSRGPPRPIRLGVKRDGKIIALD